MVRALSTGAVCAPAPRLISRVPPNPRPPMKNREWNLRDHADAIRFLAMDAVEAAKSGHPGMPMGMADVATVLFTQFLKFDATAPGWPDRDRFILSAGHGSMLLYALAYLTGYERMTIDEIRNFRQLHSLTPGHPEVDVSIGAEMTTGPLGQGISTAVGFALAERLLAARFGSDLVDHFTYVIASDGDLQEGISHEASSLAGHLSLGKLIVLWDDNSIQIDGSTGLAFTEKVGARYEAYGWHVQTVDGHDPAAIAAAITAAQTDARPSLIACKTVIGFGAPTKGGTKDCHGSPLGAEEIAKTREALGWTHEPFTVPQAILEDWREAGRRGQAARNAWEKRFAAAPQGPLLKQALSGTIPAATTAALAALKDKILADKPALATRVASGNALEAVVPTLPTLIGGSADLTPSNNTKTKSARAVTAADFSGQYIHYGVREHAMAAAMNGMALHGGIIPYGGTFLQFTDYCRPAIRLAALMKTRSIFVMTHDSIGLGEDGPTHQPVEHVAALRAIPNLLVFRPCDAVETAEAWEIALGTATSPSVLALTRQNLPTLRSDARENLTAKGGYVLFPATGVHRVTLIATGSEVEIAAKARSALEAAGIGTSVVSLPCWSLFEAQSESYRAGVIPANTLKIGIEAGVRMGWDRWIGPDGIFIGMKSFGESAPYQKLYEHFGITEKAVVEAAKARLSA
jgi:transketolase